MLPQTIIPEDIKIYIQQQVINKHVDKTKLKLTPPTWEHLCVWGREALKCNSKIFIEVGVSIAKTVRVVSNFLFKLDESITYFGVDYNWGGRFRNRWWIPENKNLFEKGKVIFLEAESREAAKILLCKAAFIFIDCCHCYDCVRKDITAWSEKIEVGGYLVFHDTGTIVQGKTTGDTHDKKRYRLSVCDAIQDATEMHNFTLVGELDMQGGLRCYRRNK